MSKPGSPKAPSSRHNNEDLLVWACFAAGGENRWLDIEEIFYKAYELAPSRMGWRTREDLADKLKCAKALQAIEHPTKSQHPGFLLRRGEYKRKLSVAGRDWCERHRKILERLYGSAQVPAAGTQDASRTIRHLEASEVFHRYRRESALKCERWELAEALNCMVDSDVSIWVARLDRLEAAARANSRQDVADFVKVARQTMNRYFDEGSGVGQ
jgi:hypothetical protein